MGASILASQVNGEGVAKCNVHAQSCGVDVAVNAAPEELYLLETKVKELEEQRRVEAEQYRNIITEMASTCRSLQTRIRCLEAERGATEVEGRRRREVRRRTWQPGEWSSLERANTSISPRQSVDLKTPLILCTYRMDRAVQTETQVGRWDCPQYNEEKPPSFDDLLLMKAWLWY